MPLLPTEFLLAAKKIRTSAQKCRTREKCTLCILEEQKEIPDTVTLFSFY